MLAIGTTAGIVVQTIALLPALRAVHFPVRLRWDWRGAGFRSAGPFAAWMVGYVLTNQLGYLVIVNLATASGRARGSQRLRVLRLHVRVRAVLVAVRRHRGVGRHGAVPAHEPQRRVGHRGEVANTLAGGLTMSATLLVPMTALLVALGPLIGAVVFAHGNVGLSDARLTGATLAAFAVGLVPFSAFQVQLRGWLALHDSRTPAQVNLVITAVNVVADLVLYLRAAAAGRRSSGSPRLLAVLPGRDAVVRAAAPARDSARPTSTGSPAPTSGSRLRRSVAVVPGVRRRAAAHRRARARPESSLVAVAVALVIGAGVFAALARRMRIRELDRARRPGPRPARARTDGLAAVPDDFGTASRAG